MAARILNFTPDWWPAPAKLNLFLHITARRSDGYHDLQTLFQLIDFGDELQFIPREDGLIRRLSEVEGVPETSDLVVRAANMLQKQAHSPLGADINIHKRLPMGGGLGGGSSDAATTLVALNHFWNLGFTVNELAHLGGRLGADVPVFVHGFSAWAEGIGEQLNPVELPPVWYIVIVPGVHISTSALFSSPELTRDSQPITIRDYFAGAAGNAFESIVRSHYPEVDAAFHWLAAMTNTQVKMTGTGSCIFAAVANERFAQTVVQKVPGKWQGFYAKSCNKSPLLTKLSAL